MQGPIAIERALLARRKPHDPFLQVEFLEQRSPDRIPWPLTLEVYFRGGLPTEQYLEDGLRLAAQSRSGKTWATVRFRPIHQAQALCLNLLASRDGEPVSATAEDPKPIPPEIDHLILHLPDGVTLKLIRVPGTNHALRQEGLPDEAS